MKIIILGAEQSPNTGAGSAKEAAPKPFDVDIVSDRVGYDLVNFVRVMRELGFCDERIGQALLDGMSKGLPEG